MILSDAVQNLKDLIDNPSSGQSAHLADILSAVLRPIAEHAPEGLPTVFTDPRVLFFVPGFNAAASARTQ